MPVRLDLQALRDVLTAVGAKTAGLDKVRVGLGRAAESNWKNTAKRELKSTSKDYVDGISRYEENGPSGKTTVIELNGRMPNMVEQGWGGGDMREWMLRSRNVKHGANGRYAAIPFRHGSPGTSGRNVGAAMPAAIHKIAKDLEPTRTVRAGMSTRAHTQWGGRVKPGSGSKAADRILATKMKPHHTTGVHSGMVRQAKKYPSGAQSSKFTTFRTISENSGVKDEKGDHLSWLHPGIKARHLAKRVRAKMEVDLRKLVDQVMGE